ncbi:hypothetical protein OUZ56_013718 [Daphnia magna]|uniref:Uncharacterized protein n=1 Tax=Daphnia magna TaxID=35525 RepID=A0ABQ9Z6R3_9CRUS|nr:hypothetical protein OUZ56_013718 [Daphnia magna]
MYRILSVVDERIRPTFIVHRPTTIFFQDRCYAPPILKLVYMEEKKNEKYSAGLDHRDSNKNREKKKKKKKPNRYIITMMIL